MESTRKKVAKTLHNDRKTEITQDMNTQNAIHKNRTQKKQEYNTTKSRDTEQRRTRGKKQNDRNAEGQKVEREAERKIEKWTRATGHDGGRDGKGWYPRTSFSSAAKRASMPLWLGFRRWCVMYACVASLKGGKKREEKVSVKVTHRQARKEHESG